VTSQWFECPCHGSQYNQVGEKKAGPAPRGMDHFPLTVAANGDVVVNTGVVVTGAALGTNTTGQEAEGPHCITGGGEH
jgi:cytochrome b6-f complex iron-sulfur subunit